MKGNETKHSKAFIASKLKSGETVVGHLEGWIGEMMGSGDKTQHNGQFILTNMRACFYRKGILGEVFEVIPLEKITSIETLSRMGYRVIRLHTSHDELAFKTFESSKPLSQRKILIAFTSILSPLVIPRILQLHLHQLLHQFLIKFGS